MGNVLNTAYKVVADVIESEENINIEQGTIHVIDDKLKVHLDGEIKEVSTKSYKVYTALLTQTGTDAPVATVLENTIGDIWWTYVDVGFYSVNSNGLFVTNKTYHNPVNYNLPNDITEGYTFIINDNNTLNLLVFQDGTTQDSSLVNTPIEIRVYN